MSACTTGLVFRRDQRSGALFIAYDDGEWENVPASDLQLALISPAPRIAQCVPLSRRERVQARSAGAERLLGCSSTTPV
eukprot:5603760-Pleurochrysis_carterae.AAC.1